jgi:hypothetical protein
VSTEAVLAGVCSFEEAIVTRFSSQHEPLGLDLSTTGSGRDGSIFSGDLGDRLLPLNRLQFYLGIDGRAMLASHSVHFIIPLSIKRLAPMQLCPCPVFGGKLKYLVHVKPSFQRQYL